MKNAAVTILMFLFLAAAAAYCQNASVQKRGLEYSFDKLYGQVEVGGRYAGTEFHNSHPLPSRISFYYPVANSIDLSTDYWKRETSQPMAVGIKVGAGPKHWIGKEPWAYMVSPHKVAFRHREDGLDYSMRYEFCLNEPAMLYTVSVKNNSGITKDITLYIHLKVVLRTCQSYSRKDSAFTSYDSALNIVGVNFEDADTDSASVFVQNVGVSPASWATDAAAISPSDTGTSNWISTGMKFSDPPQSSGRHNPVAAFEYRKRLEPGESIAAIQIIGSCKRNEVNAIAGRLKSSWKTEIRKYDELVTRKSKNETHFITQDSTLDQSVLWSKGILTANAHYINGSIVPMPCPAEYNFFFTHDVMMTDLGAVNFDLPRVKDDLLYVASLAKDSIIPHAYYWRDDGYKTEYCTPDNWNHFWFILTTGSYLRHSLDESTVRSLYPLVTKSLTELLTTVKSDHLMYAFRPDWWDIGHIEGPRSYTTILAIRALREYLFMSSFLGERSPKLNEYENIADAMQKALVDRLWDGKMNYLTNYNGGKEDEHYYMGSLLAVAFDLLDNEKANQLLQTASAQLFDSRIGVRTAMPPDFHTKESIEFYKFAGEEAGRPYFYINGGVWPHDNSWYAVSLNAIGKSDSALQFVKHTMTLYGILNSPLGQPAMYEYRYADPASPEYGKIDKPNFLWAGGFYLKTLYALFGARDNEWNLSFSGGLSTDRNTATYTFTLDKSKNVKISGKGNALASMVIGGSPVQSLVLPIKNSQSAAAITIRFGKATKPYMKSINAIVDTVYSDKTRGLHFVVRSFQGHNIKAIVAAPSRMKQVLVDGTVISNVRSAQETDGLHLYEIQFTGTDNEQHIEVKF
jgi:hypothetical protein